MEISYQLIDQDYKRFQRFHQGRKPAARIMSALSNTVMIGAWLFCAWLLLQPLIVIWRMGARHPAFAHFLLQHYWQFHHASLTRFFVLTLLVIFCVWGQKILLAFAQRGGKKRQVDAVMRLDPQNVTVAAGQGRDVWPWSKIQEIQTDREAIYLYLSATNALIVPRRAFASPQAAEAFEGQAREFKTLSAMPTLSPEETAGVWPPPPVRFAAPETPSEEAADPPGTIRVHYATTRADHWRFARRALTKHPTAYLLSGALIAIPFYAHLYFRQQPLWAYPVAALAGGVFVFLLTLQQQNQGIRKLFPTPQSERACVNILRPDVFIDQTPTGRHEMAWAIVGAIEKTPDDIIVAHKNGAGRFCVPLRAFESPEEAERVYRLMIAWRDSARAGRTAEPEAQTAEVTGKEV